MGSVDLSESAQLPAPQGREDVTFLVRTVDQK